MLFCRRLLLGGLLAPAVARSAAADEFWYPIPGSNGRPMVNFRMPVEIEIEIGELDSIFYLGPDDADVTLTEIYDSNCGFCRRAAADIAELAEQDGEMRVRYVNAPSLGLASFQAARVEYAVKRVGGASKALDFHKAFMAERGFLDGPRALLIAGDLDIDVDEVERVADQDDTGQVVRQATRLANAANLSATPSFIIGGAAIVGYPGRATLERILDAVRSCDKPVCG